MSTWVNTVPYGVAWSQAELEALADTASAEHGIPPAGLRALLARESAWNTEVVSPAGAMGVAQFMGPTAGELGVDPFYPPSAIDGSARYLAKLRSQFGEWPAALAGYNWGPGNVARHIGEHGELVVGELPRETRNYVENLAPAFRGVGAVVVAGATGALLLLFVLLGLAR